MRYDVRDIKLAKSGQLRIEWAGQQMPVVSSIRDVFRRQQPLKGLRVSCCLHVTSETANLAIALKAGGADVAVCASNPLSTQDEIAAALVKHHGIPTFAIKGESSDIYYRHIKSLADREPHIVMDDGADLISTIHQKYPALAASLYGATEETTTGVVRLRSLQRQGLLQFPVIAVNDAQTKSLFDNRYGTGQSTIDGILRATNLLLAGRYVVVAGYGWCGKGVARRAQGMGAKVIVTEVDPIRALEAAMDGFEVMPMDQACRLGDLFVTVTGNTSVIRAEHFRKMKDGAIVSNAGHFNVELDLEALAKMGTLRRGVRPSVDEYRLSGSRRVYVLAEGRLVNLGAAEGHPAAVMDMSFADQALAAEYMAGNHQELRHEVYVVPVEIDRKVAQLKLRSMGLTIDRLTPHQEKYLSSWEIGT